MRKILIGAGLTFVVFLILVFVKELPEILVAIRQAKWHWLLLSVLAQIGTYVFLALLFQDAFDFFGYRLKFARLFKISFYLNYLNQTLPLMGLPGIYFLMLVLKKDKIPADKSIVAGLIYYILIYFTFFLLFIYAFFRMFIGQQITRVEILATLASAAIVILILVAALYVFRRQSSLKKALTWTLWPIHKMITPFSKNHQSHQSFEKFFNVDFLVTELQGSVVQLNKAKLQMVLGLVYAFLIHILDVLTIFFIFLAFNYKLSFSAAAIGFVFGSLLAHASLIPGGIGVEEVSRGFIFSRFGVPLGVAMLVSLLFRSLTFYLNIPIGTFAFKDLVKSLDEYPEKVT